jgi:anti-anti-sigma factor
MNATADVFEVERAGHTAVVVLQGDLRELDWREIQDGGAEVQRALTDPGIRHLILDLSHTDYCGSTALGIFAGFWRTVRGRKGRLVLCHVSERVREALAVLRLDTLWPIYPSRAEALSALNR